MCSTTRYIYKSSHRARLWCCWVQRNKCCWGWKTHAGGKKGYVHLYLPEPQSSNNAQLVWIVVPSLFRCRQQCTDLTCISIQCIEKGCGHFEHVDMQASIYRSSIKYLRMVWHYIKGHNVLIIHILRSLHYVLIDGLTQKPRISLKVNRFDWWDWTQEGTTDACFLSVYVVLISFHKASIAFIILICEICWRGFRLLIQI